MGASSKKGKRKADDAPPATTPERAQKQTRSSTEPSGQDPSKLLSLRSGGPREDEVPPLPPDSSRSDVPVKGEQQHEPQEDDNDGPPPLPDEAPPLPDEAPPLPAEEGGDGGDRNGDELEDAADGEEAPPLPDEPGSSEAAPAHGWQAIWEPTRQAYYFWNSQTNETTWINPLQPANSASLTSAAIPASEKPKGTGPAEAAEPAQASNRELFEQQTGIDSDLAFLDPSLSAYVSSSSGKAPVGGYVAQGQFDARKGKFVPVAQGAAGGTYDPTRMTHGAQAKRQMDAFFDTDGWQAELERRRQEEAEKEGGEQKRVTKKDLQRFKERKMEKKKAKYDWLRS